MGRNKRNRGNQDIHASDFLVSDNYIFYKRLYESEYRAKLWEKVANTAKAELEGNLKFFENQDRNQIGDFLLAQAAAERQKELNFMETVFGIDISKFGPNDYPALINKLNELIGLKDEYDLLLTALRDGIGDTEEQRKKGRGFGATQYLEGYLATNLSNNISSAMRSQKSINIIKSGTEEDYNNFITKIIDKSIEDTIKQIANTRTDTIAGVEVSMWEKIEKLLEDTEKTLYGNFKSELYKRYNLDDTKREIKKFLTNKLSSSNNLKGLSTTIRNSYTMNIERKEEKERFLRGAEGYMDEFIQATIAENMVLTEKGTFVNRRGTVLQSNVAKTDTISLYSANANINLQPLLDKINSAGHFNSLVDAQDYLNDFNNKLQSMPDNFVVYESVKKYATNSDNFRGFHGGKVNVRDLELMFAKTHNEIDVEKLMITLLNTMSGAILVNGKAERKKIVDTLSSSMATFLFDDWESLGNTNNEHALHIFVLNTVRVPLSYLLYAAGTAIKDTKKDPSSIVKFSFELGKIKYPDPIGSEGSGTTFEGNIKQYWDEQRQEAFEKANFSATFLQSFNSLITDLIARL